MKNGMNFTKEEMGKGYPFVNIQDVFGKTVVSNTDLGLAESSEKQRREYNLMKGDILFIRSSVKPEGVGEAALIPQDFKDTTYSGFIIRFRPIIDLNDNFKRYIFLSENVRNQIMAKATSSANTNINQESLEMINLFLPLLGEKEKIGNFFVQLDNTIALLQRKLDKLKQLKKGFLQQMFPQDGENVPRLRFANFDGEWEERKLKELSHKVIEKNKENLFSETLTNSAEFGIINQRDFFDKDISNEKNLGGYYVVHADDFVYNPRISNFAPVGPIKRNKLGRTGVMSPLYYVFRTHDIDNSYLEVFFDSTGWHNFMKLNADSGARADRFAIKDSVFIKMPIPYPSSDEQVKIGEFFKSLDFLIPLLQIKLDKLETLKKFFLQKMFI